MVYATRDFCAWPSKVSRGRHSDAGAAPLPTWSCTYDDTNRCGHRDCSRRGLACARTGTARIHHVSDRLHDASRGTLTRRGDPATTPEGSSGEPGGHVEGRPAGGLRPDRRQGRPARHRDLPRRPASGGGDSRRRGSPREGRVPRDFNGTVAGPGRHRRRVQEVDGRQSRRRGQDADLPARAAEDDLERAAHHAG
jgi:hypothetical protein